MASVRKLYPKGHPKHDVSPWIVEYTNPVTGKRVRATPKTGLKKDADAMKRQIERDQQDGTHIAASQTVTVSKLCDLFLENAEERIRDGRLGKARGWHLQLHARNAREALGHIKLTDLTRHHIDQYYTHLTLVKKLAPMTAKDRMSTLKAMEGFAVKRELMAKTPVTDAMKDLRGIKKPRINTFTQEQIAKLLQTAATSAPFRGRPYVTATTECFVNLATFCGLRFGEIVGLTLANIDLQKRVIRIRHSFCRVEGLKGPKTEAGNRDVPMAPHIAALFQQWLNRFYEPNATGLLFTNYSGRPIAHTDFYVNQWMPLLKRAGIYEEAKPLHFHALRHFAASWMITNGLPLTDVAKVLGHETFDTTLQVYAHPISAQSHVRDSFDVMASRMLPPPSLVTIDLPTEG